MNLEPGDFDISCTALVELVTDYLDGTLPPTLLAARRGTPRGLPRMRERGRADPRGRPAHRPAHRGRHRVDGDRSARQLTAVFRDLHHAD